MDKGEKMEAENKTSVKVEEKRWITFELSDKQILEKANQATTLNSRIKDLEHQKKEAADNFKGQIDGAKSELSNVFATISSRTERLEVECVAEYDYAAKKVFYYFDNEVMEESEMSEYDFTNRPADILPEEKEDEVKTDDESEEKEAASVETGSPETEAATANQEAFFDESEDLDAPEKEEPVKASSEEAAKMQDDVNTMMVGS